MIGLGAHRYARYDHEEDRKEGEHDGADWVVPLNRIFSHDGSNSVAGNSPFTSFQACVVRLRKTKDRRHAHQQKNTERLRPYHKTELHDRKARY